MKYINEIILILVFTLCMYWCTYGQADEQVMNLKVAACNFQYVTIKDFLHDRQDLSPEQDKTVQRLILVFMKNCNGLNKTLLERQLLNPVKTVNLN